MKVISSLELEILKLFRVQSSSSSSSESVLLRLDNCTRTVLFPQLFSHPKYVSCKRIAVFLSMHDEVQTDEILQDVFQRGKSCFIPRYESNSNHMDMLELRSLQDMESLPLTSWNIRQPTQDDDSREEALASGEQHGHTRMKFSTHVFNFVLLGHLFGPISSLQYGKNFAWSPSWQWLRQ